MKNEQVIDWVTYLVTYVRKEEKKQSKRGNKYWYFCNGWEVEYGYNITDIDKAFCYPTEADCIKARDKILALRRIKEYCNEQWWEFIPDRSRSGMYQNKYFIYYNSMFGSYEIKSHQLSKYANTFYLQFGDHCKEIIEKFKDDLDILFINSLSPL